MLNGVTDVHITILDLPGQLEKAKVNIEREGLSHRISCMPLNLLDHTKNFPRGMDVIWMSQFLDCFSKEDIGELLASQQRGHGDQYRTFYPGVTLGQAEI